MFLKYAWNIFKEENGMLLLYAFMCKATYCKKEFSALYVTDMLQSNGTDNYL